MASRFRRPTALPLPPPAAAGAIVLAIGLLVAAGWLFGFEPLTRPKSYHARRTR